jgi:hypothetical protein
MSIVDPIKTVVATEFYSEQLYVENYKHDLERIMFLDFVHRLIFLKNTMFWKLDVSIFTKNNGDTYSVGSLRKS